MGPEWMRHEDERMLAAILARTKRRGPPSRLQRKSDSPRASGKTCQKNEARRI
jgi:hypothetical protein